MLLKKTKMRPSKTQTNPIAINGTKNPANFSVVPKILFMYRTPNSLHIPHRRSTIIEKSVNCTISSCKMLDIIIKNNISPMYKAVSFFSIFKFLILDRCFIIIANYFVWMNISQSNLNFKFLSFLLNCLA